MSSVMVGMFDTKMAAELARGKLVTGGFSSSAVTLTGAEATTSTSSDVSPSVDEPHREGVFARFFENLFGSDTDADDHVRAGYTDTYNEAFKRGGYGVSVTAADDAELDKAERILNDAGAVDINEKAQAWRKEGMAAGNLPGATEGSATLDAGTKRKLQEVEEELKVGKRAVAKGGVRIFTRMTEVPVTETVRLREEHADVKRTAVDRPATEADFAAFKEGSIEVREMSEEAVVSKTARVTGEVEIGKTSTEREETVHDTVRKTKVDVEQIGSGDVGSASERVGSLTSASTSGSPSGLTGGSANRDPITGAPGAHPIGTGVGAVAGGVATGAAIGTVAGPVGTAVGAAVGAVAGGLAGKGVAEQVDPTDSKATRPL